MTKSLLVLVSTVFALAPVPPAPDPAEPVNYVDWIDKDYSRNIVQNAADEYVVGFAAFVVNEEAQRLSSDASKANWDPGQIALLQRWISANESCMRACELASKIPSCFFQGSKANALLDKQLPHVSQMTDVCQLFITRARLRLLNGDSLQAVADVCTMLRASYHMRTQPHMVEYLTGMKLSADAYEFVLDLLAAPGGKVDYVSTMELIGQAAPSPKLPLRQNSTERLVYLDVLQRYCEDRDGDGLFEGTSADFLNLEFDTPETIHSLIQEYDKLNTQWTEAISSDYASGKTLAQSIKRQRPPNQLNLAHAMMSDPWQVGVHMRHTQAVRNALHIVFLFHDFYAKNGRWPEDARQAIGDNSIEFLDDPFSSGELIYKLIDGKPFLYSVGLDGEDSGGKRSSNGKPMTEGVDYVFWPRQSK